jgi:predicted nucleic acid-binding protein
MIILDTNVLSELTRPNPNSQVNGWLREQSLLKLGTTAINIAELKFGMARLPDGRRRRDLERKFAGLMSRGLAGRVFDFDQPAADIFGDILVARERMGRRLEGYDGLIAAIARSRGFAVATRNIADFEGCGVTVLNPWDTRYEPIG